MNNQTVVHLHIEIKRNELSSPEKTWRKLKCIILSERSQSEKPTNHIIPNRGPSGKGGTMRTVKRQMVSREKAGKEGEDMRSERTAGPCSPSTIHKGSRTCDGFSLRVTENHWLRWELEN